MSQGHEVKQLGKIAAYGSNFWYILIEDLTWELCFIEFIKQAEEKR